MAPLSSSYRKESHMKEPSSPWSLTEQRFKSPSHTLSACLPWKSASFSMDNIHPDSHAVLQMAMLVCQASESLPLGPRKAGNFWSFPYGATGSAASLECWDTGSIPSWLIGLKDRVGCNCTLAWELSGLGS